MVKSQAGAAALPRSERAKGSPASARGEAKRSHILNVALGLFAERGYDGTSLRSIAEAAGVDHPLVKYHFHDKDTLWRDAVRLLFERMDAELRRSSFTRFREDPRRAFSDVIGALVRYNARHPEHARLMVLESVRDTDRIRWAAETFIRRQHVAIKPWLDASIAHGFLPELPRHELVTMLNALCHITFTLAPMVRHSWSVEFAGENAIEAHVDAVLAMLGHGRQPMKATVNVRQSVGGLSA
jgi:AcrR family transcriptional regulator